MKHRHSEMSTSMNNRTVIKTSTFGNVDEHDRRA